jgi:RNA polymerase sigma-70 factor, ECF subfamily
MNMHSKEQEIISMMRVSNTRDKGFTLLMETYKERIYWHIRRLVVSHEDTEDILQETFINVYRYAGSFNGKSRLYTWLYRIATNECIRWSKKDKRRGISSPVIDGNHSQEPAEHDMESRDSILYKFQKCILLLPEKQRIVFNLRYYDELSYEDISEITGTSVNSLKTNYHYACEKIKEMLRNQ